MTTGSMEDSEVSSELIWLCQSTCLVKKVCVSSAPLLRNRRGASLNSKPVIIERALEGMFALQGSKEGCSWYIVLMFWKVEEGDRKLALTLQNKSDKSGSARESTSSLRSNCNVSPAPFHILFTDRTTTISAGDGTDDTTAASDDRRQPLLAAPTLTADLDLPKVHTASTCDALRSSNKPTETAL